MALALTLLFLLILVMGGSLFFIASQTEIKHGSSYTRRMEALSVAESAAERALWKLQSADWFTTYSQNTWNTNFVGDTDHPIRIAPGQYMRVSYPETIFSGTDYANLKIIATGILGREEGGKVIPISTKKIEMIVRVEKDNNMPLVFDYAYFINNWGWWYYAGGERCRGCMRSNGRFDVRSIYNNPSRRMTIDGSVEAQYAVDYHNYSPDGLAGLRSNPPNYETEPYRRPSLEKENIPNLQDMDYYGSISTGWNPDTNEYNDLQMMEYLVMMSHMKI
ncbi:hypothetical protein HY793_03510 [Candidatus Desantisbacteria bacterium]|nr:hypothetical protein [Candidatus Desantisbacteria bacterium]